MSASLRFNPQSSPFSKCFATCTFSSDRARVAALQTPLTNFAPLRSPQSVTSSCSSRRATFARSYPTTKPPNWRVMLGGCHFLFMLRCCLGSVFCLGWVKHSGQPNNVLVQFWPNIFGQNGFGVWCFGNLQLRWFDHNTLFGQKSKFWPKVYVLVTCISLKLHVKTGIFRQKTVNSGQNNLFDP